MDIDEPLISQGSDSVAADSINKMSTLEDQGSKKRKLGDDSSASTDLHSSDNKNSKKRKIISPLRTKTDTHLNKFTIKVESSSDMYSSLQTFMCDMYITQYSNSADFSELRASYVRAGEQPKIYYKLPEDTVITVTYEGHGIECFVQKISTDHGTNHDVVYLYELSVTADTKAILDKLIFEACEEKESLLVYHYKAEQGHWQRYGKVQKRDESTLIIKKEDKDRLMMDVDEFITAEEEYDRHGMPYKRNYLFYGKPGTGKTSLVNVIANRIKRNINIISFDSDLGDSGLYSAVNSINGEKAILLLEDIDCIFHDRSTNMNNSKVSFSALLNVLDGVSRSKGLITIITTNYVKKLDKALLRPGRTDMMIEFTVITREQIEGLLAFYKITLDHKTMSELVKLSQKHELTPSVFSGFMFRKRKSVLDSTNYLELFKKYLAEIDVSLAHNDYQSMFS